MPRNGVGGYSFPATTWDPAVNGVTATAADWNTRETDVAAALTASVAADGQTPMTGNLPLGGNKVTGGGVATATTDLATFGQVSKVLLGSVSASASATVDFTGLAGASYSEFEVVIDGMVPSTNASSLVARVSTGSGFLTTNYRHETIKWTSAATSQNGSTSDSGWVLNGVTETCGTGANQLTAFNLKVFGPAAIYPTRRAVWSASGLWASGSYAAMQGGGEVDTQSAAIDGIRFLMSAGTIASGTFYLYGLRNS